MICARAYNGVASVEVTAETEADARAQLAALGVEPPEWVVVVRPATRTETPHALERQDLRSGVAQRHGQG